MVKVNKKSIIRKFIIDTNVLFSALYSSKTNAGKLLDFATEKKIELYAPDIVKIELKRNLMNKLKMHEAEADFTIKSLAVNWIDKEDYARFIDKAKKLISEKDTPILASHFLKGYDIIIGDKEFRELKDIEIKTLKKILDSLK